VTSISHIINFDIPQFCDDYVHRVGRTGRMGREGVAYTFVTPEEGSELTRIEMRINRLLKRDEIEGFQAFGDPRPAEGVVLGEGPGYNEDDYVEPPKPAPLPVFGKPVRRIRKAL
jgi:ATP-dependent RNA helicase DeaD